MNVYVILEYESYVCEDRLIGIFSNYESAMKEAKEYAKTDCNVYGMKKYNKRITDLQDFYDEVDEKEDSGNFVVVVPYKVED